MQMEVHAERTLRQEQQLYPLGIASGGSGQTVVAVRDPNYVSRVYCDDHHFHLFH
jgi:hypothetical protein